MCELGGMNVAFRVPLDGVLLQRPVLSIIVIRLIPLTALTARDGAALILFPALTLEKTIACTNKHRYAVVDNNKVHLLKN